MAKIKEIIVLILGVLFGTGVVVLGYFDSVNYYLITLGITIALSAIGIELGVNLIPHSKAETDGLKIDNEIKRLSLERRTNDLPANATTISTVKDPSLKEAIKGFVSAIAPKEDEKVEEKQDDFPLSSQ